MANMALNIEQRLGQKLTPVQEIMWYFLMQNWPNLTFQRLYYVGSIPYTVYNANTLYVAYELTFSSDSVAAAGAGSLVLYDATNNPFYNPRNAATYWDATAAAQRAYLLDINLQNIYFSRITTGGYNRIKFDGYILTI